MTFEFKDIIAVLALGISLLNLLLYYLDIKPTLKIGFYSEDIFSNDEEMNPTSRTKYFSIDIVNHSSRRIKVANISVEWMKSRWFSFRRRQENYPDFHKDKPNSFISSFWIEPWGDESFSAEEEDLTTWLWDRTHYSKNLWVRIVVTDALGKHYKSRMLKI
jgi:hypothetical protein